MACHSLSGPTVLFVDLIYYFKYKQIHMMSLLLRSLKCITTDSGYKFYMDVKETLSMISPLLLTYGSLILLTV